MLRIIYVTESAAPLLPKTLHDCYRKRCTIVTESAALVFTENAVFSVSVYRHAGHEHLGLHHLSRFPVNVRERLPGEVHEELLTRVMIQDASRLARFKQLPQVKAELGVTVPAGVLLPVLLPQEVTCHVGPAEFFFKVRDLAFEGLETLFLVGPT